MKASLVNYENLHNCCVRFCTNVEMNSKVWKTRAVHWFNPISNHLRIFVLNCFELRVFWCNIFASKMRLPNFFWQMSSLWATTFLYEGTGGSISSLAMKKRLLRGGGNPRRKNIRLSRGKVRSSLIFFYFDTQNVKSLNIWLISKATWWVEDFLTGKMNELKRCIFAVFSFLYSLF